MKVCVKVSDQFDTFTQGDKPETIFLSEMKKVSYAKTIDF